MGHLVSIIGRPNVGKSTLFNRLTESREAITDSRAGTTRDRHYGTVFWNGRYFTVVDTGGYVSGSEDVFETQINRQVLEAVKQSDVVLFLVDAAEGLHPLDQSVAEMLRASGKPVIVVANKADNYDLIQASGEFFALGFEPVFPIAAINGSGTGELLDYLVNLLKPLESPPDQDLPRFAVVGRPNVGKSSLVNTLLGEERHIVTPVAGTTRDSVDSLFKGFGMAFYLVDTAGLRKKGKDLEDLEFYSVLRTLRAMEKCDVCLLVCDAQEGFGQQELHILSLAEKLYKGIVILVNKWDLITKEKHTTENFRRSILEKTAPFTDVPIVFTSTVKRQRVLKAFKEAVAVYHRRTQKFKTSELNEKLLPIIEENPPPSIKGKYIHIKYITQLPTAYPSFAFFCNLPQYIREPYKRFLENKMRQIFDLKGCPIAIYFRAK
ncbi:MAG: ribosome biogenesis GTPase Der [Flavobacteriales bacterium]|nr:ribosome biogenesis GTPase Der [Flavobacteriales bacterium]MCX7768657.1 ribosome biogenesis GTPase Der [Flavobacteriales bacterium]MDW8410788.1 ribosome biogenesis GTPase Der [Flavobacteriales bacterium]